MCGILTVLSHQQMNNWDSADDLKQMAKSIEHRGPDDLEISTVPWGAMGITRLSIMGGATGKQPITNEDKTIYLVCNGEIYNHQALMKRLTQQGHVFRTTSDCEVIIHLYEEEGIDACLNQIRGQYSFLLLDSNACCLYAARDRFGINPLYYYHDNQKFVAASEIKAIYQSQVSPQKKLDIIGIYQTAMLYGAIPPRTCFENICTVPEGHYLKLNLRDWKIQTVAHWQCPISTNLYFSEQPKNIYKQIHELLKQAIRRRLQGDGSIGCYFSGGLDSSIVTTLLHQFVDSKRLKVFSIQFTDRQYDETHYQQELVKHLGFDLHTVSVKDADLYKYLEKAIWHIEAPITRLAPVGMFLLSQLVRSKGVKFVLCGEGADEMFFGYPIFSTGYSSVEAKYAKLQWIHQLFHPQHHVHLQANLVDEFIQNVSSQKNLNTSVDRARIIEINTKLSGYLLSSQGDRMSMAHSVEQRFPFLDEELSDLALQLKSTYHLDTSNQGKFLLRQFIKPFLPPVIIQRKKQGYLAPFVNPFDPANRIHDYMRGLLSDETTNKVGCFDTKEVQKLVSIVEHNQADPSQQAALLMIITTHMLHSNFIG